MSAVRELITKFGFEIDDHGLKELDEGIESIKEGLLHLGEALIGEAVGLYEFVAHAAEAGESIKHMSQETGVASDKLQELQFRANLADISTTELNQSMVFLARNMNQAAQGSEEARKHFRELGISTAELKSGSLTADQALQRISKRFEHLPDGIKKTGLATEIFGRSGARMIPFLNELREELDPINKAIFEMSVVTEEQIHQSIEFTDGLKTLKTGLLGVARVIGFGLMPEATEIIDTMKRWLVENRKLLVQNLTDFVKGMTAALKLTVKIVDALVQSFAGLAHSIGGVKIMTEVLLGLFAILSGTSVLFGIGKVMQAVVALGNAFGVANLKAAAIPIAIGAAMIGLALIMEDIYSFFNGKKSFTGDLLAKLPEIGKLFQSVFGPIFQPIVNIITMITEGFGSWKTIIKELGVLIGNVLLAPLRLIISLFGGLTSVLGRLVNSDAIKAFGEKSQAYAGKLKLNGIASDTDDYSPGASASSLSPQQALGGSSTSKQVNNDIKLHQEFTVTAADPTSVGTAISSHTSSGLDDILRQTNQSTKDGGAY